MVAFGITGYGFTVRGKKLAGGILKLLSTAGISVIGLAGSPGAPAAFAFILIICGEATLSIVHPLTGKAAAFMSGLGLFLCAYLLLAMHFLASRPEPAVFIAGLAVTAAVSVIQARRFDKASGPLVLVLGIHTAVLCVLAAAAMSARFTAGCGACLLYFSDSVIAHMLYDNRYAVPYRLGEFLVTASFCTGLALVAANLA